VTTATNIDQLQSVIRQRPLFKQAGHLVSARGILSATVRASLGELCHVYSHSGHRVLAEVVGFSGGYTQLMPLESVSSISAGETVVALNRQFQVPVGRQLLGRVLGGLGHPIDSNDPVTAREWVPLTTVAPDPMKRTPIETPLETGQKAVDGLLTIGKGQRVGLFAGSGVGKSTLLGEIAKNSNADVNVVVLVGERGREVRPFIEHVLGKKGLQRSVVIVSTAEQPPLVRIRSAQVAVTIADWFRSQGNHVLFMVDSLTRLAWSQRELGLSLGEIPSSRGFPPSSIQLMANLIEQLGNCDRGAITGLLTVLVDGDDTEEPVADAARSILDGHIVLSRRLAEKGHFPAIDISKSISRVANDVTSPEQQKAAMMMRKAIGEYADLEDMIRIGAYKPGTSPSVDHVIRTKPAIDQFLQQATNQSVTFPETTQQLLRISSQYSQHAQSSVTGPPGSSAGHMPVNQPTGQVPPLTGGVV